MEFNISAKISAELDQPIWVFSDKRVSSKVFSSLTTSYERAACQLNSDNPILMRLVEGAAPNVGQIARCVFLSDAFKFDGIVLINHTFWQFCMPDMNFNDTLHRLGAILSDSEQLANQIETWQRDVGLLCFNVYRGSHD